LGYNPIGAILQSMGPTVTAHLSQQTLATLTGQAFFPNAIADPFMSALRATFYLSAILCFVAAICSALRSKKATNATTGSSENAASTSNKVRDR
jgi:hypothetical protein